MSSSRENNGAAKGGNYPKLCSFTPTEQKVMDALIDYQRHLKKDLVRDIGEGDWSDYNLQLHIHNMNRKMPKGHEIICEVDGMRHFYRYIVCPV